MLPLAPGLVPGNKVRALPLSDSELTLVCPLSAAERAVSHSGDAGQTSDIVIITSFKTVTTLSSDILTGSSGIM